MKHLRLLSVVSLLTIILISQSVAQPGGGWRRGMRPHRVLTVEGGFTCLMPDSAVISKDVIPITGGTTERITYAVGDTNAVYQVSYFDYPDSVLKRVKSDTAFLNAGRDGFVKSLNGKLQFERPVKLGPYTGYDLSILTNEGTTYRIQIYMVNRRFYQVQTVFQKDKPMGNYAEKFFESFMLVIK